MDRLEAMRIFVAVAEAESFSGAARRLRLSAPAVTRAVAGLEERLGVRLLHRTTRIVRVTEAGERFLRDAARVLADVDEAELSASRIQHGLRGPLAITAPALFGRLHVAPVLLDFLGRHPDVTGRALFVDRVVDLVDEGIDVAVRIARLADSALSAVRVGAVRRVVCASPEYLRRSAALRSPRDLAKHDGIGFVPSMGEPDWAFRVKSSRVSAPPRTRLLVNGAEAAVEAAVAGFGVVRALSYQVAAHVRDGSLVIVLSAFEPPELPVHVVHAQGHRATTRVRAFVDFAVPRLRAAL